MNAYKILKHTRHLLSCRIKIEPRTKSYMLYLDVNESEAFLKSVSIFGVVNVTEQCSGEGGWECIILSMTSHNSGSIKPFMSNDQQS